MSKHHKLIEAAAALRAADNDLALATARHNAEHGTLRERGDALHARLRAGRAVELAREAVVAAARALAWRGDGDGDGTRVAAETGRPLTEVWGADVHEPGAA